MKIIDCYWEFNNLNEHVCEISVEDNIPYDEGFFKEIDKKYTYQVVKVPTGNTSFALRLQENGYFHIESQLNWTKKVKEFNYNNVLIIRLADKLSFEDVTCNSDLNLLLDFIDDQMFSTDRISLDPIYGPVIGRKRYCNWIRTEFINKSSSIAFICYEGKKIGFLMLKTNNKKGYGLLGGIFTKYQNMGFGVLTASSFLLYIKQNDLDVRHYYTSTSSNNPMNFRIYNFLGFDLNSMIDVYVKHVK